jgi:hypothetical protein
MKDQKIKELLDELKKNGKIETVFVKSEMNGLGAIIENMDNCSKNHNLLLHVSENAEAFLKAVKPFGFDEPLSVQLYLEISTLFTILTTETFRILLLLHTKDIRPNLPLGPMLKRLEEPDAAPKAVAKLKPFMDIEFRNALAHGLVGVEAKKIVLYKNAKFEVLDRLELADFMMRAKEQNVLTQCFINVITEKKRSGFFT